MSPLLCWSTAGWSRANPTAMQSCKTCTEKLSVFKLQGFALLSVPEPACIDFQSQATFNFNARQLFSSPANIC
jgi:hypothetical protein